MRILVRPSGYDLPSRPIVFSGVSFRAPEAGARATVLKATTVSAAIARLDFWGWAATGSFLRAAASPDFSAARRRRCLSAAVIATWPSRGRPVRTFVTGTTSFVTGAGVGERVMRHRPEYSTRARR